MLYVVWQWFVVGQVVCVVEMQVLQGLYGKVGDFYVCGIDGDYVVFGVGDDYVFGDVVQCFGGYVMFVFYCYVFGNVVYDCLVDFGIVLVCDGVVCFNWVYLVVLVQQCGECYVVLVVVG